MLHKRESVRWVIASLRGWSTSSSTVLCNCVTLLWIVQCHTSIDFLLLSHNTCSFVIIFTLRWWFIVMLSFKFFKSWMNSPLQLNDLHIIFTRKQQSKYSLFSHCCTCTTWILWILAIIIKACERLRFAHTAGVSVFLQGSVCITDSPHAYFPDVLWWVLSPTHQMWPLSL